GNLIRMSSEECFLQLVNALFHRLDEQDLLVLTLDLPLPAIHGVDSRNDVDAGGQALLHEVDGQRLRIERSTDGRQNDDGSQREQSRYNRAPCSNPFWRFLLPCCWRTSPGNGSPFRTSPLWPTKCRARRRSWRSER